MKSASDIEIFVALCQRSNFRSRDEILDGIRSKKYELIHHSGKGVPTRSMLETYKRRSRHVGQLALQSRHARQMVRDIDAYVSELENAPADEIMLWSVSVDSKSHYSVFEGVSSGRILGCIFGVDKRAVSRQEWDVLWGHVSAE